MRILETLSLTRRFGELTAVNEASLGVEPGEVFGLVGPNGAGKTTLIKMLTTLLPPTSGSARIMGFDIVHQARSVRARIGYVPQLLSADGTLTGFENLMAFAALYDIPRAERRERARNALAFVGLSDFADKVVKTYSGGMIRRLEIAQSTLHRPPVLFLDEPTIGLDPIARKTVWEYVGRLREESGTTVILTTHYMEEADILCDRVAIMHLGRVVAVGSPSELKLSVGGDGATLDDVFAHYTGNTLDSGGTYRDASRTRRTAYRLG
jgi:ABC-2 type transport system ATP-binding protein